MLKFFRTIRRRLLGAGNIRNYFAYAIGEILLVVIGILIAVQINDWQTNRNKRAAELQVYKNIERQIGEDQKALEAVVAYNNFYKVQYTFASQIIENSDRNNLDTLGRIALNLSKYSDFNRSSNIYETIVNSGELSLLTNDAIIENLQRLEETYTYINRLESNHFDIIIQYVGPEIQNSIRYATAQVERPEQLYTFDFQNLFQVCIEISTEKGAIYEQALREIATIQGLIHAIFKAEQ